MARSINAAKRHRRRRGSFFIPGTFSKARRDAWKPAAAAFDERRRIVIFRLEIAEIIAYVRKPSLAGHHQLVRAPIGSDECW